MTRKKLRTKLARSIRARTGLKLPQAMRIARVVVRAGGCVGTLRKLPQAAAVGIEVLEGSCHEWEAGGPLTALVTGPRGEIEVVEEMHRLR